VTPAGLLHVITPSKYCSQSWSGYTFKIGYVCLLSQRRPTLAFVKKPCQANIAPPCGLRAVSSPPSRVAGLQATTLSPSKAIVTARHGATSPLACRRRSEKSLTYRTAAVDFILHRCRVIDRMPLRVRANLSARCFYVIRTWPAPWDRFLEPQCDVSSWLALSVSGAGLWKLVVVIKLFRTFLHGLEMAFLTPKHHFLKA
jgi:hypothetical protein